MLRTREAGTLRAADVAAAAPTNAGGDGEAGSAAPVVLAGWVARRRDHGGVAFLDLRDASGSVQVVVRDELLASSGAHDIRNEWCLRVSGTLRLRPVGNENLSLPTGEVELEATSLEVLNPAAALPFPVEAAGESAPTPGEEVRLHHRYLDLRRPGPASALRLRSAANAVAREVMGRERFVEVETPTLTRSTPEGARDFLVPARLAPGAWYALPQSPQLFKQLLMVAGLERYYQIARCYRDEDFRADRQPEFTQLDVEMSFVETDDVIAVAEQVVTGLWKLIGHTVDTPIARITWADAMARYGSDKPDLRFGVPLTELTPYFSDTPFRVFQAPYVGAVVMPGGAAQPRKALDAWQEWAKQRGARGLAYVLVGQDGTLSGPVAKNLSQDERDGLATAVGAMPGDCVFFAAGTPRAARTLLGAARLEIGKRVGLIDASAWSFVWVVDAPLFEPADEATASGDVAVGAGAWTAVHHAFTAPKPASLATLESDPGSALSDAYDLVCNGNEIGGGSIRIHSREVQERVFAIMGLDQAAVAEKFGFLLEAFGYGAPPHGGIAFGWDRVVALLAGADSIREVIAFPKSGGGYDPLTGAPAAITSQQRREAGVDAPPPAPVAGPA